MATKAPPPTVPRPSSSSPHDDVDYRRRSRSPPPPPVRRRTHATTPSLWPTFAWHFLLPMACLVVLSNIDEISRYFHVHLDGMSLLSLRPMRRSSSIPIKSMADDEKNVVGGRGRGGGRIDALDDGIVVGSTMASTSSSSSSTGDATTTRSSSSPSSSSRVDP